MNSRILTGMSLKKEPFKVVSVKESTYNGIVKLAEANGWPLYLAIDRLLKQSKKKAAKP